MKPLAWLAAPLIMLNLLAGCAAAAPTPADPLDEIAGYEQWHTLTTEPRDVSSAIMALCRMPSKLEGDLTTSEHGWSRLVWDYVNDKGQTVIDETGGRTFPEGSIIVKEKFLRAPDDGEADGLGFMIKRAPGFNPEGGDWEFMYWEAGTGVQYDADNNSACQACHASVADADFVFFPHTAAEIGLMP